MRKSVAGVVSIAILVAACGGFGSEGEEQQQTNQPPPSTPENNAKPPPEVEGKPVEGIYVSASQGRAGATGFPGSPLNTLAEGILRAKATNLRVIVCAEEYAESITVVDGVSAYGYYDCSAPLWKRVNKRAVVRAPGNPALIAHDVKLPTRFEGFELVGPNLEGTLATAREGTSVGVEAKRIPPNIFFISDSVIRGGHGAPGAEGEPAGASAASGSFDGNPGIGQSFSSCDVVAQPFLCAGMPVPGVKGPTPTCGAEQAPAAGGSGGDGMWFIENQPAPLAVNDQKGRSFAANAAVARGGVIPCGYRDNTNGCGQGDDGVLGAPGAPGGAGAWSFDAEGFVPGDGQRGTAGVPGQSGGGGAAADLWFFANQSYGNPPAVGTGYSRSARGGSGGAGGCGGMGGGGGHGGGASIGLLAIDAPVVLERVIVEGGTGGGSGLGAFGGTGSAGGKGGIGQNFGAGDGGKGGTGGFGGPGAHGVAGPSIALAFSGAKPAKDQGSELRPGAGGAGRAAVTQPTGGRVIPATAPGQSLSEFEIKP